MKRILSISLFLIACFSLRPALAQDIQLHYDFGRNIYTGEEAGRQKVTATLEQFKADKWGSWYYFVDFDFTRKSLECVYTEISREFRMGAESPFAAHVEYDGGLSNNGGSFQHAALIGPAYNGHSEDFSKTWSVQLLYKQFLKGKHADAYSSAQLTGVWSTTFAHKKCTFSGFIDFWRGEKAYHHGCLVVLSEPQLWFNATEHFSIGTEWEFSNNFVYNTDSASEKTFFVNPTLAVKWNF